MAHDEIIKAFERTIYLQLRTLGVVLYDDVGNRINPGSGGEHRVVNNIARNLAQHAATERENQKLVAQGLIHAIKFATDAYDNLGSVLEADLKEPLTIAKDICQTDLRDFAS